MPCNMTKRRMQHLLLQVNSCDSPPHSSSCSLCLLRQCLHPQEPCTVAAAIQDASMNWKDIQYYSLSLCTCGSRIIKGHSCEIYLQLTTANMVQGYLRSFYLCKKVCSSILMSTRQFYEKQNWQVFKEWFWCPALNRHFSVLQQPSRSHCEQFDDCWASKVQIWSASSGF